MKLRLSILLVGSILAIFLLSNCGSFKEGFNFFTPQDDIALGKQVKEQIESDPKQFPILPEKGNEEVYRYIRGITNKLLQTGKVEHKNEFAWEVKIIKNDSTLNAFCVPGAIYMFIPGLSNFLIQRNNLPA